MKTFKLALAVSWLAMTSTACVVETSDESDRLAENVDHVQQSSTEDYQFCYSKALEILYSGACSEASDIGGCIGAHFLADARTSHCARYLR